MFDSVETSAVPGRILMSYGNTAAGTTSWLVGNDYVFSTLDHLGSIMKYANYNAVSQYFSFGNESSSYWSYTGITNGEVDFWNTGKAGKVVQARAQTQFFRSVDTTFTPCGGIYQFIYKNSGQNIVNSFKIYPVTGNLLGGRFTLYCIR